MRGIKSRESRPNNLGCLLWLFVNRQWQVRVHIALGSRLVILALALLIP